MKNETTIEPKMNKAERRKAWLLKHYALCGQLGLLTGSKYDGKKISTELFNLERIAHAGATACCNGENIRCYFKGRIPEDFDFHSSEDAWERFSARVTDAIRNILGSVPKGFFVNGDARGYALKLEAGSVDLPMHQDWGSFQILSPSLEDNI